VVKKYVIDGCAFTEGGFYGLSKEVLASELDGFFLTIPGQMEGFHECLLEIGKIYGLSDDSSKRLAVIKSVQDLEEAKNKQQKGIILSFQDPHPIENSFDKLRIYYEMGLRVCQLTYNKMNYIGTGCLETKDNGLTDYGKKLVKELNRLGVLIDLSHCSYQTAMDTFETTEKPIVFSHAGAKALTDNPRNKTDEEIKRLKENGGVIGLSPWGPLCWKKETRQRPTLDDFLDHVDYVVDLAGVDHVAFGGDSTLDNNDDKAGIEEQSTLYAPVVADYNQYVGTDPDVRHVMGVKGSWEMHRVEEGLRKRGYTDEDIAKFTGNNFLRVMKAVWR
jgi:membrane dipeptidase